MEDLERMVTLVKESQALMKNPISGPPRRGLVYDDRRHRWIRPKKRSRVGSVGRRS